jgi:hypothetical protein
VWTSAKRHLVNDDAETAGQVEQAGLADLLWSDPIEQLPRHVLQGIR